jgi:hypothetical protein
MAGFDLRFCLHSEEERELLRVLLRAVQLRARERSVDFSYKADPPNCYWLTLDGSLLEVEPLLMRLMFDLPAVAEGFQSPTRLGRRRRFARRLTNEINMALRAFLEDHTEVAHMLGGLPVSLTFDVGRASHLRGRMTVLSHVTTLYLERQIDPETMLEEMHTALETLLRSCLGTKSKDKSFVGMVDLGEKMGLYSGPVSLQLKKLNSNRRSVKHGGQGVRVAVVDEMLFDSLMACQSAATYLRTGRIARGLVQ